MVLVCWFSVKWSAGVPPLVSVARVSAGRGAADRNGDRHEGSGTETATGFKKEIMVGHNSAPGSPDPGIVAFRPGGGLGLPPEAQARSERQLARKKET